MKSKVVNRRCKLNKLGVESAYLNYSEKKKYIVNRTGLILSVSKCNKFYTILWDGLKTSYKYSKEYIDLI